MTLKDFIIVTNKSLIKYKNRPKIVCNDGFTMSVQASETHYCSPRVDKSDYSELEIGFPSRKEVLIESYAENREDLTNTVYGWVPESIIKSVIEKHGGINIEKTFEK